MYCTCNVVVKQIQELILFCANRKKLLASWRGGGGDHRYSKIANGIGNGDLCAISFSNCIIMPSIAYKNKRGIKLC